MARRALLALAAVVTVVAGYAWWRAAVPSPSQPAALLRSDHPLTFAAAGDVVLQWPSAVRHGAAPLDAVCHLLGGATWAMANLEVTLTGESPAATGRGRVRPHATSEEAGWLARCGINVVSRANNHVADHGADGVASTGALLDRAGIRHAGAGPDLGRARDGLVLESGRARIVVFSVATSSSPDARATWTRGEIKGRPGLNPLRHRVSITADAATFDTLRESLGAVEHEGPATPGEMSVSGTTIRRGDRTVVEFVTDERDERDILSRISAARTRGDIVVVALHSHEPANASEAPADFVRRFARAAIEGGASLVVGHGPRRLRGIEVFGRGVVLYSVGTLVAEGVTSQREHDLFDSGTDLYRLALGSLDEDAAGASPDWDDDAWWEAVVAVTTFEHGRPTAVRLHPIDLGTSRPVAERGLPALAEPGRGLVILERMARLSAPFGTGLAIVDGVGHVHLGADGDAFGPGEAAATPSSPAGR